MTAYPIETCAQIWNAQWLQKADPNRLIRHLMLDTRHIPLPGALFFAIPGVRHNGHRYLPDAYRSGVRDFVVSQHIDPALYPEANILQVPDTLRALQQVAAYHRSRFHLPVVGITGSNGKTIVKEWLAQVLAPQFHTVRSPKSYNSQTGVPLSVWAIHPDHQLAIFEAGISQPEEMEHLAPIIQPTLGIFTNIGPAHREGFPSESAKIAEKMRLFEHCHQLVYCTDHPALQPAITQWLQQSPPRTAWSWSANGRPARIQVMVQVDDSRSHTHLEFSWDAQKTSATIPFSDSASIENAIHCFVAGLALGAEVPPLVREMAQLEPVEMRLELKSGIDGSTLVNDFYNNDLASLRILLQLAVHYAKGKKTTLILSDILQSGQAPEQLYQEVAAALTQVDRFIGIGTDIPAIAPYITERTEVFFFPDTSAFLAAVSQFQWQNHLVLIKGARPFAFERIARRLEQKAHQTRLEINLNSLIHNLNVYRSLLKPGVKLMAMVKAAAYGSGSGEVARLLEYHQTDYLGVAYADEGIELRNAGVQAPILVLNPVAAGFDIFQRYQLEPEIFSLEILRRLIEYTGNHKSLPVHLKLDTGMHRLGFEPKDLPDLIETLRAFPNIKIASVFTHLSASDNPAHDGFTHRQAATYTAMYEAIAEGIGYRPLRHIVNTGGVVRFPEYHFDMVRLGIGLYGVDAQLSGQLQVVNTLKATISQIKHIPPGDSVGYNRNSGILEKPAKIATISIGYADGYLRLAGGGRHRVLVNGQLAPTIGNVCMDMTMIDISGVEGVKPGDEVVIFGQNPTVQALADTLQTIPYEVFTNISDRVKRVYVQE